MRGRFARWHALPNDERRALFVLALTLPLVAASLRMLGFDRTRRALDRTSRVPKPREVAPADLTAALRLAQLAASAARASPLRAPCLPQSLTVRWLLRRRGFDPTLEIGVRRVDGALDAHAWVELDGVALAPERPPHLVLRPATR